MTVCHLIDRFLDGELSGEESARFQRHLAGCEACQTEYEAHQEFQRWVDQAKGRFDHQARDVGPRIQRAVRWRRNRPRRLALSGIAATVALAIGWSQLIEAPHEMSPEVVAHSAAKVDIDPASEVPAATSKASVLVPEEVPYLAVPLPSTNPNVTIIWLHPTYESSSKPDASTAPPRAETLVARRMS